ncbi:MAG: hypothetical protein MUE85_04880 [Microscillaceae bacterium]|jgi:hypothetical protein|nr:hypothetical protein [Microscillaceae bacterium]
MKKQILQFLFLTLLVGLVACGGGEKKENTENKSDSSPATEKETPKSESSGKEDACQETKIALTGEGDFKLDNFEVKGVQIYRDMMQSGEVKYPALILTLSNYPKEGDYVSDPTKEGDVRLIINFSGKGGSTITAQSYDIAGEGFGKADALVASYSTKDKSYGLNLPSGKAEITYLSADRVCGTIDVKDKSGKTTVKGTFSVALK